MRRGPVCGLILAVGLTACAAARWDGPATAHFDGKRFHNEAPFPHGVRDLLRFYLNRERGEWARELDLPPGAPPPQRVGEGHLRATFVNHATVLLQADGLNLLTDPIWSLRASPVAWAGPKRYRPAGIAFEDLPPIDVVIISHNHYDHLDLPTLRRLHEAHDPVFVVGLGDGTLLRRAGLSRVVELDWWQSWPLPNGCRLHGVPVRHWSGRRILPSDRNLSLWMGYVMETRGGPVYFAGDTGYDTHFRDTSQRYGAMRLALLPIGAYLPRWLTEYQHMSPEDAVQAHLDLESAFSIGVHWGTFEMADDGQWQPVQDLAAARSAAGVAEQAFIVPEFGAGYAASPLRNGGCS